MNEKNDERENSPQNVTSNGLGILSASAEKQGEAESVESREEKRVRFFEKKSVKNTGRALACAVVIAGAFFGGFFTHKATLPKEINSLLWAKERIQEDYLYEISDEQFYNGVFFGVNSLLDRYSGYMTASENAAAVKKSEGEYNGVGIYFRLTAEGENGEAIVARAAGGSPAEAAGIAERSKIVGCGANESELEPCATLAEFSELLAKYAQEGEFYVRELRYPYGADDARTVKIKKEKYRENYVYYRSAASAFVYLGENATETEETAYDGGAFSLSALPSDTAYIRLTQFNGNAAAEFDAAMKRFKTDKKKNLVLDIRGNGGGDMDILRSIASYFCKSAAENKAIIAKAVYRDGSEYAFQAKDNLYADYFGENSKVYVLADSGTASASECLLGVMIDYGCVNFEDVCLIVGEDGTAKTFGKGIMQTTRTRYLWNSEAIKLTSAKICWPVSGRCIHGVGLTTNDGCKSVAENFFEDGTILDSLRELGVI